jgi:hypothetical protein
MKGLFSALLILTLAAIVTVPFMSEILNSRTSGSEINVYITLLIVWILLAVTLGIIYLASEGAKNLKPIPLPVLMEEGK